MLLSANAMFSVVEHPIPVKVTTLFSIFSILKRRRVAKLLAVSDIYCLKLLTPLSLLGLLLRPSQKQ